MNYRSIADLNSAIKKWIIQLPKDFDLIAGIPRSGLLVANLLALYLNKPMTDVDGLCKGKILNAGPRLSGKKLDFEKIKKVLVVDDSVCSGNEMKRTKAKINKTNFPFNIYYGAVYVTPQGTKKVDFWYEILSLPRVFEWNILHHDILQNSCVDLDGVLCREPTPKENDDGPRYQKFLRSAEPLIIPTKPIGWIVTCRLRKYRNLTEEWLKKHGVKYNNLIMLDLPDKKTRQKLGIYAKYKAKIYKSKGADLFIESSKEQAIEIAKISGKPVFCFEGGKMINPKTAALYEKYSKTKKIFQKVRDNPVKALTETPRFLKQEIEARILKFAYKKRNSNKRFILPACFPVMLCQDFSISFH